MKKTDITGINDKPKVHESVAIKGAFSLTLSTLIIKILGLIYKLPLSNILGDEGMGYFNSAYTAFSFFYIICTAGVPKAVMILLSKENNEERTNKIVKLLLSTFLIFGIIITGFFACISPTLARAIGSSKSALTMVAIAPSIVFISISGVLRGLLSAKMNFLDIAISQILEGVGKLVFGLLFAVVGRGRNLPLELTSALTILGVTIGSIFGLLHLISSSKPSLLAVKSEQKIKINKIDVIKELLRISVPITLSAAIMSITNIIDLSTIMSSLRAIGYTESEAAAYFGNYSTLSVPMFNMAMALITPISVAFMPLLTKANCNKNNNEIRNATKEAIRLTAFVSAPITLGLMLFSKEILTVLFKNSDTELGSMLLVLLAPSIIFSSMLVVTNSALEALGYFKVPIISMLVGGIWKLVVSYLLIRNPNFGISGAPIGTVISYATALLVSLMLFHKKTYAGIPVLSTLFRPYFCAIFSVTFAKYIHSTIVRNNHPILALMISITISAITYFLLTFVIAKITQNDTKRLAFSTNYL